MTPGMSPDNNLHSETFEARKTAVIDTELQLRNVNIAALQETRLTGAGSIKESNCTFYWFGMPDDKERIHGTGFFSVHNSIISSIQTPSAINERLSFLKLTTKQGTILVISAYAHTVRAEHESEDKDHFYKALEDLIRSVDDKGRIVLLDDMNARVGNDLPIPGRVALEDLVLDT